MHGSILLASTVCFTDTEFCCAAQVGCNALVSMLGLQVMSLYLGPLLVFVCLFMETLKVKSDCGSQVLKQRYLGTYPFPGEEGGTPETASQASRLPGL